jgi:hypothetical protein
MRFGLIAPKLNVMTFTAVVFDRIEEAGDVSLSIAERDLLGCLINAASHVLQITPASPTAGGVRAHLKRIAATGRLMPTVKESSDVNFIRARELVLMALRSDEDFITCEQVMEAATSIRQSVPSGRGRSIDEFDLGVLWSFADFFEEVGGKASAAWSEIRRNRNGPFMRFLRAVAASMPSEVGTRFVTGIEDRTRRMLAMRKDSHVRHNFAEIDFSPFRPKP